SHNAPIQPAELEQAERIVREIIAADEPVCADLAPLETARSIAGLRAVFGEQYPDPVRVVSVGRKVEDLLADPANAGNAGRSIEFCGGTHAHSTGEIRAFAFTREEGVAKGVRRIEAVTGVAAEAAESAADALEQRIADAERLPADRLAQEMAEISGELDSLTLPLVRKHRLRERLAGMLDRVKQLQKERAKQAAQEAA